MSCGCNDPLKPRTNIRVPGCGGVSSADLCDDAACPAIVDDRLAAVPPTQSLNLLGKRGRGLYSLSPRIGFVMGDGTRHFVSPRPEFGLPPLRKFIPAGDGSDQIQATAEGVPLEDFPPPVHSLHVQTEAGQWNSMRGPTEQDAILFWDGFEWITKAPHDGRIKGPLPILDKMVIVGTKGRTGCDEFEQVNRLNPAAGFVVGDGTEHSTLACSSERQAPIDNIKVFGVAGCTSRGPMIIPLPETGMFAMCGGSLIALEAPKYTALDQANKTIPAGKNVGSFVEGATLQTDGNGCLGWKLPSTTTATGNQKLVFGYTGTQQYATVPLGYTRMSVKCWGAAGTPDGPSPGVDAARGGVGGFTQAVFPVTAGDVFTVIVGQTVPYQGLGDAPVFVFGFGGPASPDSEQEPGGGLSGVFTGNADVLGTDDSRALIIAGGGGAGGASNPGQNLTPGGNGNASNAGGQATFYGANGTNGAFSGSGAGGGGYRGGSGMTLAGRGGTGFIAATKISGEIVASADATVAGSQDVDYAFPAGLQIGNGRVVIEFLP